MRRIWIIACVGLLAACGGDAGGDDASINSSGNNTNSDNNANNASNDTNNGSNNPFEPEVEEFAVRTVAATDRYVFVPNSADEGTTVARVDGRDLSVTPVPVGPNPGEVVAFTSASGATIAVVLVEGTSAAAVIRADENPDDPADMVNLLAVPDEVNALEVSADGRHVLAYIDPDRPLRADASVSSLQAAALLRIGDSPDDDEVFDLSVTRLIRDVEIVNEGRELYIVGREGVNRLILADVDAGAFVPPLDLRVSDDVFPPTDLEIEVASDGSFFALRSSAFEGVSIHPVDNGVVGGAVTLQLPDIPTDIDLYVADGERLVLASIRDASELAVIDVDAALSDANYVPEAIAVHGASAGLAQLTPDLQSALLYSTLPLLPTFGIFDFASRMVRTYALRNAIRSVAVSPDSATAIVVHDVRDEADTFFQANHGLTIVDLASGYRRPITLQAKPVDLVMTTPGDETSYLFALLESASTTEQGVLRVDLRSFRTDFVSLAREPRQIGLVAGKIFIAQEATEGRITFIDVGTLEQRTLSGYELNAGID